MGLLASAAYQLIRDIFPYLKQTSDCFGVCFPVMSPAGKSFRMA